MNDHYTRSTEGTATPTTGGPGSRSSVCRCGQELDICHGSHCPRCGATLARDQAGVPHLLAV